jgi:hypothetical protein
LIRSGGEPAEEEFDDMSKVERRAVNHFNTFLDKFKFKQ